MYAKHTWVKERTLRETSKCFFFFSGMKTLKRLNSILFGETEHYLKFEFLLFFFSHCEVPNAEMNANTVKRKDNIKIFIVVCTKILKRQGKQPI